MSRPVRISLANDRGEPELNVPDAPQALRVRVTNVGDRRLTTSGDGFALTLRFRRGTLERLERIRLAAHSTTSWHLAHREVGNGDVVIELSRRSLLLAPDESADVVITGVCADERGGTRTTRVEAGWSGLRPSGADLFPESVRTSLSLLGVRLAHADALGSRLRTGSVGRSGPFVAGVWPDGPPLTIATGAMPAWPRIEIGVTTTVTLAVVNVSGEGLRLSGDDDAASRIEIEVPRAEHAAPWGLVAAQGDRLAIDLVDDAGSTDDSSDVLDPDDWFVHHLSIRRLVGGHWGDRQRLLVALTVRSSAMAGCVVPVRLRYVDFSDVDDGELVVLFETVEKLDASATT